MKKKSLIGLVIVITFIIAGIFILQKADEKSTPKPVIIDPGFNNYISGYTSGIISSRANVIIKFAFSIKREIVTEEEILKNVFNFSPRLKGQAYFIDDRTIEFRPSEVMPYANFYNVEFHLGNLIDVPEKYKVLDFQFQTSHQNFQIESSDLEPYVAEDITNNQFKTVISTHDFIEPSLLEQMVGVKFNDSLLELRWEHDLELKTHTFTVENIKRVEKDQLLEIKIEGDLVGIDDLREEIEIPSSSNFKLMKVIVVQEPDQYLHFYFSDPLMQSQDLRGLIQIEGVKDLKFSISGNEIKAYPPKRLSGTRKVKVSLGIKSSIGYKIKNEISQKLTFEALKPFIRLIGKGVIIPNSKGLNFTFEAVNLSAVDIQVIKIFENNIVQFLQEGDLDRGYQIKRVGRLILKKKIDLISPNLIDYGMWNAFAIDLSELIKTEPGAIYRIELSIKKEYSLYPCASSGEIKSEYEEIKEWDNSNEIEQSYWDNSIGYQPYTYYSWQDRNNPCHDAYFANHKVVRNVLSSDLGIIAKAGTDKNLVVAVTNILTTTPMSGVEIEIYNFQQQLINSKKTDDKGLIILRFDNKPFLLIAKKGSQRGYLKLNDGSSLSLSKFDVSGKVVQKGIKGYIYGERGVWRPGDSLFVSFVLEDKHKLLPDHHPVIFELFDPNGQIVKRIVSTQGHNGFYTYKLATDIDAPTGRWTSKIRVGGTSFTKSLRIEAIKPNRLKIKIDFGTDKLTAESNKIEGKLNVKWLHGAIARNLKAEIDVKLSQTTAKFDQFSDYSFDDPAIRFNTEEIKIFDDRIDEVGNADISTKFNLGSNAAAMLKATFLTRVFEEGGAFSVDQFSIPYAPYNHYVGLKTPLGDKARGMLLTDENHTIEVVTVDANGKPEARKDLQIRIYKVHWRWWWESGIDNLASYVGSSRHTPISKGTISTDKNGIGSFDFSIKYPNWGRYLIRIEDQSGHSSGKLVYVDWPGWAGRGQRENPGGAQMLMFSADKVKYKVGEMVKVAFPSTEGGRALVSIENGSRVLDMFWVNTKTDETIFEFKVSEKMSPNIYLNLTLVQPHKQTVNDLPIRMYGIISLKVEDPQTKLKPIIDIPKQLRSEAEFEVKVKEKEGRQMTYTLAIVDEGLLDITRFKTPNPWESFFAKEALGVKTWDVFDYVLGAYGGKIQQVFAIGGDEELINKNKKKAIRFKPVVKFLGPFTLKANESLSHKIKLPKYIGAIRTMIVAGNQTAYGFADESTLVKNPLMLLATLPRVVGPKEKISLPVSLFVMDENIKEVKVQVESNEFFKIIGETEKTISVDKIGELDLNFDLEVTEKLGIGEVHVIARSKNESADYDIEIDIRAANPPMTETYSTVVKAGGKWEINPEIFGTDGTNSVVLEVSNLPPIDFGRRLKYLLAYPHGCIEQTVSAAFPQLYLSSVMELSSEMKSKIQQNIEAALERLLSFQLASGGFSYWPGGEKESEWGTSYAGHFMIEAEKKGYTIPIGLRSKWILYQSRKAKRWSVKSKDWTMLDQAYRLYTLVLAGEIEIGAMNRLREKPELSKLAKWRLAAAYAIAGKKNIAHSIIKSLDWTLENYRELSYTYGSTLRDQAMILETYALLDIQDDAIPLMELISKNLSSGQWMSTQTTAYCLIAMVEFSEDDKLIDKFLNFEYNLNGKLETINTDLPINQVQLELPLKKSFKASVKNNGTGVIYANLSVQGTPLENKLQAENNNLSLDIEYRTLEGKILDVSSISQGTDFKAIVTIKNTSALGDFYEMTINQIFPSGWEIMNSRLLGVGSTHEIDQADYQDIRDDRIYTYFDLKKGETKSFVVILNAAYVGEYFLPAINCEAMYDNRINGRSEGKWVKVTKD